MGFIEDLTAEDMKDFTPLLFQEFPKYDFINPELDFEINPDKFIDWLKIEGQSVSEDYAESVSEMCEYSCLYLAMKFMLLKPKGEVKLVYGKFGFWGHWWVEYTYNGKTYILDLTLKQFVKDAPKLAITEASYDKSGYFKDIHCDYSQTPAEYCKEKRAFQFYAIPK